jgi:hypothetical protein
MLETEIRARSGAPLIRLDEGLSQLGRHLLEREAGIGGETFVTCLERIPRQLQAQLPGGDIIQKGGPVAVETRGGGPDRVPQKTV